jgi:Uncharacterized protein conserved in bacteria (DUF2125)
MTPKPLPARIKGWQRNGGLVEMTSLEFRGGSTNANAQGTIRLSEHGGVDGLLELSGADYDSVYAALTGKTTTSRTDSQATPEAADNTPQHVTRRLPGGGIEENPGVPTLSSEVPAAPTNNRKLPALRFADGAVYFGSISLGRLPALF